MTSKSSFWVDIRENNKRRTWLWVISWLFFLLYNVVGITLTISNAKSRYGHGLNRIVSETEQHRILVEAVKDFFDTSLTALLFFAIVLSVLTAMQDFHYLNKRRQIDFYHSLPVKKSRRFIVIWLNGIMIYLVPSLAGMLLAVFIAAVQGLVGLNLLAGFLISYLLIFVLYLAIYHVNLIAMMLTGNFVIGFFLMIILQGYEAAMYGFRYLMMEEFFDKFSMMGKEFTLYLTPYYWFAVMEGDYGAKALLWMTVQALLFLAIAYFLYHKRPAEAAGRALAFHITRPIIKIGLAVPLSLLIGMMFRSITNYGNNKDGSLGFIMMGMLITVVLTCCLMEVIYDFDIKSAIRKKHHILISGAAVFLIFFVFRFDIFGYDKYVPAADKVESYAVRLPNISGTYFWEDGSYAWAEDYIIKNMFATDAENICALAANQPDQNRGGSINVVYRLKSGRTVSRYIWIDYERPETITLLNNMVSTEAFKKGAFMVMADYFEAFWLNDVPGYQREVSYEFGAYKSWIPQHDLKRLLDAYREDLWTMNYVDLYASLPYGEIWLNRQHDYYSYGRSYGWPNWSNINLEIVEGNKRTQSVLRELGIDVTAPLRAIDVAYIIVNCYKYDQERGYINHEASFMEADEIEAIVAGLWIGSRYHTQYIENDLYEDDYEVMVYFEEDAGFAYVSSSRNNGYYRFLKGMVPDFVRGNMVSVHVKP